MYKGKERVIKKLKKEIRTGLYAYLILSILSKEEMHGYFIKKRLEELGITPSEGALYDILKSLEKMGLIKGFWMVENRPRKFYRITDLGREVLEELKVEIRNIVKVLGGDLK